MIDRCTKPEKSTYRFYGGRGIKVCDRWRESYENFIEDVGPRPSPEHSLDRIDNSGDYCPENVRWATKKEQARNKRNNRMIEYRGEQKALAEWAEIAGIAPQALTRRLGRGWSMEDAMSKPLRITRLSRN